MKNLALLVALLCGNYHVQAQAYVITTDSTVRVTQSIALDLPFIGILSLETPSYAFQQVTIPFQIPVVKKYSNRFSYPEADTLVSAHCLPMEQKGVFVEVDSLDVDG
jgi:hypothetical protein